MCDEETAIIKITTWQRMGTFASICIKLIFKSFLFNSDSLAADDLSLIKAIITFEIMCNLTVFPDTYRGTAASEIIVKLKR